MDKISIIISLKNRTSFLVDYEPIQQKIFNRHNIELSGLEKKKFKTNKDKIQLELLKENLKSLTKFKNYNFEVVLCDFNSTDYDLNKLKKEFKQLDIKIKNVDDYFSRGLGLNEGYDLSTGNIIYYCDADMYFDTDEIFKKGIEETKNNKVFFPICFDLVEPTHQIGYWRESGYGLFFISRDMIEENNFRWNEYNSLGKEDNDAFDFFKDKTSRYKVKGYYHQWHPSNKTFKNSNYKHSDYNKVKILINFDVSKKELEYLSENCSSYYFTDCLEMDIKLICYNKNDKYSKEELQNYEKKFGLKLKEINYTEIINDIKNNLNLSIFKNPNKPIWLNKVLNWMQTIENNDYSWTIKGTHDYKLSACSLFAKLGKIYSNYYVCNKDKIKGFIYNFHSEDGMFKQDTEKLKIISESRQTYSALINLNINFDRNINLEEYYEEPLFFMNDKAWENPWSAGAQLSHYIFFCNLKGNKKEIDRVFKLLEKYETPRGWLFGKPKDEKIVNGMMKVFTAFDVIGKKTNPEMLKNLADYLLTFKDYHGGCGIYDYVYCLLKCYEIDYKKDEIKKVLFSLYDVILKHQMPDGGFKYSADPEKEDGYSGKKVNAKGLYGSIHGTVLFSMALTMMNSALNMGLDLELAFS